MTGSVADVLAGVQARVKPVRDRGMLVSQVVIPRPSPELFEEYPARASLHYPASELCSWRYELLGAGIGSGPDAMRTMLLIDQFQ